MFICRKISPVHFNGLLRDDFRSKIVYKSLGGKAVARVCVCVNIICHLKRKPIIIRSLSRRYVHRRLSRNNPSARKQSKQERQIAQFAFRSSVCLTDLVVTSNLAASMTCVAENFMQNRLRADSAQRKQNLTRRVLSESGPPPCDMSR